jgi:hypothetical protein
MQHLDKLGNPNYDMGAFKKECNKIKLFGGSKSPSAPPPPTPQAPPKKEFTPVKPEDLSNMETGGKTGIKSLRIDLGGTTANNGTGLNVPK